MMSMGRHARGKEMFALALVNYINLAFIDLKSETRVFFFSSFFSTRRYHIVGVINPILILHRCSYVYYVSVQKTVGANQTITVGSLFAIASQLTSPVHWNIQLLFHQLALCINFYLYTCKYCVKFFREIYLHSEYKRKKIEQCKHKRIYVKKS